MIVYKLFADAKAAEAAASAAAYYDPNKPQYAYVPPSYVRFLICYYINSNFMIIDLLSRGMKLHPATKMSIRRSQTKSFQLGM